MKNLYIIYHLARADFFERSRRYSFLVVLGLVVFLGYQTAIGNISLQLGQYRGEFNSAWVGAMMSIIATFFFGWFGFYVVKGSIERDRETGVGQIMATTPMKRPLYIIGKWISNFVVLCSMLAVLALVGIVIQIFQGESTQFELGVFLASFLYIAVPLIALVAAITVLFESIPFLSGGFGNIVYFFLFILSMPINMEVIKPNPVFEPLGLMLLSEQMSADVLKVYPDYDGSFSLGSGFIEITDTFVWNGIEWTPAMILGRFSFFIVGLVLAVAASAFFDRFDPSRSKPRRTKTPASDSPEPVSTPQTSTHSVSLTPLNHAANRFRFFPVLQAELKLMLKGQRWWWYAIALIIIVNGFVHDAKIVREIVLPIAWVWNMLLLSPLGNREARDNIQQLTFSYASPLWRQLPAQWLAGLVIMLAMSSGAIVNFILNNEMNSLLALVAGAVFVPSLALALGVWSGTSKVFEIVYITLWYVGPMNRVQEVDFIGSSGMSNPMTFLLLSFILIAAAFIGRKTQLRN